MGAALAEIQRFKEVLKLCCGEPGRSVQTLEFVYCRLVEAGALNGS